MPDAGEPERLGRKGRVEAGVSSLERGVTGRDGRADVTGRRGVAGDWPLRPGDEVDDSDRPRLLSVFFGCATVDEEP